MSDLAPLESLCAGLLAQLSNKSRRELSRRLAEKLRDSQSARIKDNTDPEGTPYVPRKPQKALKKKKGAIRRRGAMFLKLAGKKWLKPRATPDAAEVAFAGRVQRIAQVHQFGGRDAVNKQGLEADYPARPLLGFSAADRDLVEDEILDHLSRNGV